MTEFELIVVLLAAAIPLVLLAERLGVASPILLVLAGLGVGFIPNLPPVTIRRIAERLRLPQRVLAIVQGESLLNDATALVIFAVAIEAAVHNQFSWLAGGLRLVATCGGSVAIGLAVGWLVVRVLHALRD